MGEGASCTSCLVIGGHCLVVDGDLVVGGICVQPPVDMYVPLPLC